MRSQAATIENLKTLIASSDNITIFSTQSGTGSYINYVSQIITLDMLNDIENNYIDNGTIYFTLGKHSEGDWVNDKDCKCVCKVTYKLFTPVDSDSVNYLISLIK